MPPPKLWKPPLAELPESVLLVRVQRPAIQNGDRRNCAEEADSATGYGAARDCTAGDCQRARVKMPPPTPPPPLVTLPIQSRRSAEAELSLHS